MWTRALIRNRAAADFRRACRTTVSVRGNAGVMDGQVGCFPDTKARDFSGIKSYLIFSAPRGCCLQSRKSENEAIMLSQDGSEGAETTSGQPQMKDIVKENMS